MNLKHRLIQLIQMGADRTHVLSLEEREEALSLFALIYDPNKNEAVSEQLNLSLSTWIDFLLFNAELDDSIRGMVQEAQRWDMPMLSKSRNKT